MPGLSIALVEDGALIWRRGFGFQDIITREPVDHDTIFEAASMSKPVFAYAVLKLHEKKALNLDAPLTRYSPDRFLAGDPRLDLITARHILSHSSGLQNWRSTQEPLKIHFTPGKKFLYSGEGYYYLQSILTYLKGQVITADCATYEGDLRVCATDIDRYLKTNILFPFGMSSSGYVWNEALARRTARPHDASGLPMEKKKPSATDAARYASAGGLHTTPSEYAKFLIEILDPRPTDNFRLEKRTLKEMLRPHVKTDYAFQSSWALGWQISHRPYGDLVQHGGDNAGFHSFAVASAERKSACVVMTNGENGAKLIGNLFEGRALTRLFSA